MNDMVDMAQFVEAKSDQLNSDDLIGISKTITVTRVTGSDGEQPVAIHFEGDRGKPFKPCKTMRRVLLAVWGRHASDYVGRSMTLYRDDKVTFGGLEVGGIRISHMSHMDKEALVVVLKSKGKKAGIKIAPLKTGLKADKVADGVRDLIARIRAGEDVSSDPAVAKQRAWLAEKRPELAAQVDAAIESVSPRPSTAEDDPFGPAGEPSHDAEQPEAASFTPEGRADEQHGEAVTLESAKAEIDRCEIKVDIMRVLDAMSPHFDEAGIDELRSHAMDRIAAISGSPE